MGATQLAKTVWKDSFKMHRATPHVANALVVTTTTQKVQQRATLFLPVPIIGTKKFVNAIPVIFVKVKPRIKQVVGPVSTPPTKDPLHALNAPLERMLILSVPYLVKIAMPMHTNRDSMLRNAFQSKKGFTNRVQQPKSRVQQVKQERIKTPQRKRCAKAALPTGIQTRVVNHSVKNVLHLKCLPRDKRFVANVKRAHFWRATDYATDVQVATHPRTARQNVYCVQPVTLATEPTRQTALGAEQDNTVSIMRNLLKR
jgi:hypothetical protein